MPLLSVLVRAANQHRSDFQPQYLANVAWAFQSAGEAVPAFLDPVARSMLQMLDYKTVMRYLATCGHIVAGFELLVRVESSADLLQQADDSGYPVFLMLLEACRTLGDHQAASCVHRAAARLGLIAMTPLATT
eukprot:gnl/TRDRNA2_/TRDRNA2_152946_c2_seq1.p1 gnl/TRDRNA2_/TRDRNA2_152946_c2~~gnl/TRDRNA2_/TRDRNA2_152946_c2_seq1.p1  ORF type:complete len:133 (-),score=19.99 gnl/TRDRNA2_/TRDRNA2_152946_c2_seq1:3-401(-)